jgi:hypothetical protein
VPDEEQESEQNINEAEVAARGYSPVMMNDVKKSRTALRDSKKSTDTGNGANGNVNTNIEIVGLESLAKVPHFENRDEDTSGDKKKPASPHKREPSYKYEANSRENSALPNANTNLSMERLESRHLHSVQINHNESNNSLVLSNFSTTASDTRSNSSASAASIGSASSPRATRALDKGELARKRRNCF